MRDVLTKYNLEREPFDQETKHLKAAFQLTYGVGADTAFHNFMRLHDTSELTAVPRLKNRPDAFGPVTGDPDSAGSAYRFWEPAHRKHRVAEAQLATVLKNYDAPKHGTPVQRAEAVRDRAVVKAQAHDRALKALAPNRNSEYILQQWKTKDANARNALAKGYPKLVDAIKVLTTGTPLPRTPPARDTGRGRGD